MLNPKPNPIIWLVEVALPNSIHTQLMSIDVERRLYDLSKQYPLYIITLSTFGRIRLQLLNSRIILSNPYIEDLYTNMKTSDKEAWNIISSP